MIEIFLENTARDWLGTEEVRALRHWLGTEEVRALRHWPGTEEVRALRHWPGTEEVRALRHWLGTEEMRALRHWLGTEEVWGRQPWLVQDDEDADVVVFSRVGCTLVAVLSGHTLSAQGLGHLHSQHVLGSRTGLRTRVMLKPLRHKVSAISTVSTYLVPPHWPEDTGNVKTLTAQGLGHLHSQHVLGPRTGLRMLVKAGSDTITTNSDVTLVLAAALITCSTNLMPALYTVSSDIGRTNTTEECNALSEYEQRVRATITSNDYEQRLRAASTSSDYDQRRSAFSEVLFKGKVY